MQHTNSGQELFLQSFFGRNSQFLSSFSSSGLQYSSTICSRHSFSEAVLVLSFSSGRLKCSFHDRISLYYCFLLALSGLTLQKGLQRYAAKS